MPAHRQIPSGTLLGGRYRVERMLGQGGMGAVFEAVQQGLGRRIAIKVLDADLAAEPSQLERFRREGEVVASLGHPNIVAVTDFDSSEYGPFLVMELLRGQSLGALLDAERTIAPTRIAFIAAQVLSALAAAHRAGVVHRDIKPDNIFILADAAVPDSVKVLDFGIAKLVAEGGANSKLTGTGAMLGTPSFMAPEQARGATDVDARADIYALGATMYQALTGRLPHEAASVPALLFAIVEKVPVPLRELRPDLGPDFIGVIERAMAKDRAARFASADAMRAALSPWSGLPASSAPAGPAGISTTAPTLAVTPSFSAPMATPQPTPVVHHRTPPPLEGTLPSNTTPPKRGLSSLAIVMAAVVAITAVVLGSIVALAAMNNKRREAAITREERRAAAEEKREEKREQRREERTVGAATEPAASITAAATTTPTTTTTSTAASTSTAAGTSTTAGTSASATASAATTGEGKRRYGGSTGYLSSSDFSDCPSCDWNDYNTNLRARAADINACFKASELEPPVHENPYYEVGVTAAGALHGFKVLSDGAPNLNRCLRDILFHITLHKPSGGPGTVKVGFRGECVKGWAGQCK